ncbi:MAG: glycosyltransferase, partial [Mariprofundaceae bacterium]|nr:glycosyltransferase [Mariprofundaceae bacterium]
YSNFLPALQSLGHEIVFFELWDRSAYADFAELNRCFLHSIESEQPDVVLCVTMTTEIWIETLQLARQGSSAMFIHWNPDDSWKYRQQSRLIAKGFDVLATTYPEVLQQAEHEGLKNFVLTQWAANSEVFAEPMPSGTCTHDVSFVGSAYGNRQGWITALQERGIAVQCFGFGWPNGPVAGEDIPKIMRASRLSLNFGDSGVVLRGGVPARSRQIKARVFEVPGAGGLLLTESADHLDECFAFNQEIVVFDDIDSLTDAIGGLLADPVKRDAIAAAGHARCRQEHSYEARFSALLDVAMSRRHAQESSHSGIDFPAFELIASRHRTGVLLKLLRGLLLFPCQLIWGKERGARAARRMLFELSWRLTGDKAYRAGGWTGRLFYHES